MDWGETADMVMQGITSSVLSQDVQYQKKDTLEWYLISGVFSRQYIGIDQDNGAGFVGQRPALTIRDADIEAIGPDGHAARTGDKVIVGKDMYRVDKIEVDGQSAGTCLQLKRVGDAPPQGN